MRYKFILKGNYGQHNNYSELVSQFEEEVNNYLDDGWEPQGGVSVTRSDDETHAFVIVAQAVVMSEENGKGAPQFPREPHLPTSASART